MQSALHKKSVFFPKIILDFSYFIVYSLYRKVIKHHFGTNRERKKI